MSHSIGSQLSDEDYQLSEVNQLGTPLDIYRLKPGYIRFLRGGVFYGIMARQARGMRVIVCEQGLLQVRKIIRRNRVEVVRWNNILAIKRDVFRSYYIVQQGKGALTLTLYQNIDELVELIRQRSREG